MKSTGFFKQRIIWLPRIWLVIMLLLIFIATILFGLKNSASYLAVTQPKQGDYLVVEGWQTEDSLAQALNKFKGSTYQYLIATGGPDTRYINPEYKTYAERSAAFLLAQGLDARKLIVISAPASAQNRTFLSAVMVRDYLAKKNIAPISLDIFTQGVHAKRTHELYQMAFRDDDNIGIYSSVPANYDLKAWWKTSEGAKSVITEIVGLLWVKCCFNPGKPGSHQEKWGLVKNQSS